MLSSGYNPAVPENIPESLSRAAYLGLVEAHEVLVGEFRSLFRSKGLTPTQFNVLRILVRAHPEGVPCGEISAGLLHRVPDVTRLLDRMARDGLIRRERSEADRRVVLAYLEAQGLRRCVELYRPIAEVHALQFQGLSDDELRELARLLRKAVSSD